MDPTTKLNSTGGAAAAAPSAVAPVPAPAKPAPAAKAAAAPKVAKATAAAKTAMATPPAAPAPAPADSAPTALSGAPAEAFDGLPQGGVFRRVGGRLVPAERVVGTTTTGTAAAPGAASVAPPGSLRVSPLLQQSAAATGLRPLPSAPARHFNSLFMAPPPEDAQAKTIINSLQMTLRQVFSTLEHAVIQAGQSLDYFAQSPAAAPALQAEGVDLQQVHDFIVAGNALLDQFAPKVG